MATISLCMIVKNEENVLSRCLDGLVDLMDEIIIVDTGSTDATKAIAAKYTENVYDFEWTGSFSDARNYSFSKATKEYVYVADADEVIDGQNQERFRILKEALLPEVEMVQMYYCNQLQYGTAYNYDKEYRPKLYKRLREFQWIEPVHEIVRLDPVVYDSDIEIQHLPQNNHAPRDFKTFQRMYQEGVRLSARLHHMYAMELYISGSEEDFLQAEAVFQATSLEPNRSQDEYGEAYLILAKAQRIKGDYEGFLKNALKQVAGKAGSELCHELGEYYSENNEWEEAIIWYYNAAFETESTLNAKYSREYPLQALVRCQEALGNAEEAARYRAML